MSVPTICRSTRHFYLNYHNVESSSLYLHSTFTRRLQFALRLVATFLIGGFVGYATPLRNQLAQLYMIPNIGILTIQETFGSTLSNSLQITFIIVPLSIFLFIVQKIGLSYHNYVAGEFLMLIASFYISYQCQKLQTRKICLWFNVIFFATIINQETVRSTFIFELLGTFLLGMGVALIVSLLIFPLFATFDIENRVKYCLLHLDQMQTFVLHAFSSEDPVAAKVSLARASIVEHRLHQTMIQMRLRLMEARHEPSRILQRIFNRRRRHIITLTIQEQVDLITSLMFHVCSLQAMVQECQFSKYHNDLVDELESKLSEFTSCQSRVVLGFISVPPITINDFSDRLMNFQTVLDSLNLGYQQVRLHRIEEVLESGLKTQSEDHLSHAFFFFQLGAISRLLTQAAAMNSSRTISKAPKKRKSLKDFFKFSFDRSRLLSAGKSMLIVGIGSVFVMIPRLANTFGNGQWILIALCMTQGDTVGGAFTTMKMRLMGTLLGSMWAYVIYLAVGADAYKIFGMLVPWLFLFGYLKLLSEWDYTATVAASTPILINLGRLYDTKLPNVNYVLLRIQENVIGIGLGIFLTILIFPKFAVDLLKTNIQETLKACRYGAESIHFAYDQFFQHRHSGEFSIDIDQQEQVKSYFDIQRNRFHQMISAQRTLVNHASREPSLWWFNYGFSSTRYSVLVQQQINIFRMLHSMNAIMVHINECAMGHEEQVENLRLNAVSGLFLPDLHSEVASFNRQLCACVDLWSSYFTLTQTTYYRWSCIHALHRKKPIKGDLSENRQCLIELYQTIRRLQSQHQQVINRVLDYYLEKRAQNIRLSNFVPYVNSDHAESIFVAVSAMYYSTVQLAQAALALGTTIHTVFELETTSVYRKF